MPAGGVMSPVMGLGSGKFGTPCERMHPETFSSELEREEPADAAPTDWPDEPQAAIAITHMTAAKAFGVAPVVPPVPAQLQFVVRGEERRVVDQRVTKWPEEAVSVRARNDQLDTNRRRRCAGALKLASVRVQLCSWWMTYRFRRIETASANSRSETRTSRSTSPFVSAPGTAVAPTCSTSAAGSSATTSRRCASWAALARS